MTARRRRRAFAWTGVALACVHLAVFGAVYVLYLQQAGEWLADLPLVMISMPFIAPMRAISGGSFDYAGDMTTWVVAAAAWGTALAYLVGWGVESASRLVIGAVSRSLRGRSERHNPGPAVN